MSPLRHNRQIMSEKLKQFKAAFSHDPRYLLFNNAGIAPITRDARDTIRSWADRYYDEGPFAALEAVANVELVRARLADFLGADATEVAFFQSTASAISQIALGLKLNANDEIVVIDQDYPSSFHPWQVAAERSGAKVRIVKSNEDLSISFENIAAQVTERTKVIGVSWVQYRTGTTIDLAKLARFAQELGIFTCIDIIQGAGVMPFDFHALGIDAACGGSQKWLCGGHCVGFLLLKETHIESLSPVAVGASSFGGADSTPTLESKVRRDILRFEPGSRTVIDLAAFGASLKLFSETGIETISAEAAAIASRLRTRLIESGYQINSPHGQQPPGAIVNFKFGKSSRHQDLGAITQALKAAKVSHSLRPPGIRLSPHAFNTNEEIDRVIQALND